MTGYAHFHISTAKTVQVLNIPFLTVGTLAVLLANMCTGGRCEREHHPLGFSQNVT